MASVSEPDERKIRMSNDAFVPSALAMLALSVSAIVRFHTRHNLTGEVVSSIIALIALGSFWIVFAAPPAAVLNPEGIRLRKSKLVPWNQVGFIGIGRLNLPSVLELGRARTIELHSDTGPGAFDQYLTNAREWQGNKTRYGTPLVLAESLTGGAESFVEAVQQYKQIEVRYLRGATARKAGATKPLLSAAGAVIIGLGLLVSGATGGRLGDSVSPWINITAGLIVMTSGTIGIWHWKRRNSQPG